MKRNIQRLWNFVWENLDLFILILGGLLLAILPSIGITPATNTVLSVILGALSLLAFSMIRTRIKFDKVAENINHGDAFESQEDMYKELEKYIENHRIREATLIQYSGHTVNSLVRQLVSQGADVTLYVQNKDTAKKYSKVQFRRIDQFPKLIRTEFNEASQKEKNRGTLVVYEYDPPASFKAIKLDNKILAVGWYVYKYVNEVEKQSHLDDDIKLLGHSQPGKLLYFGSREYDVMMNFFEHLEENFENQIKNNTKQPIFKFGTSSHE